MIKAWIDRLADKLDSGASLDRMIHNSEAKGVVGTEPLAAHETSLPRVPFGGEVPFRETGFGRITLGQVWRLLKVMPTVKRQMSRGARFYRKTFVPERAAISAGELDELVALLKAGGAKDIGYVSRIDRKLVFAGKTLPHPNAIVFSVEMNKSEIEKAPSFDTFEEVARGYAALGKISAEASDWLRARGFAAYPGTNLGGISDYPALAEAAGLGAIGYHGLLIGPHAGPRIRINTIYTNISNLPVSGNPHLWVRDFCEGCRQCVRSCPVGAIEVKPQPKRTGYKRAINADSCRAYFSRNWGCAVCVAVCPFSQAGYDKVRNGFDQSRRANVRRAPLSTIRASEKEISARGATARFAVVGAGPAGFYTTKALLEAFPASRVDLIERLPFPHRLVRYGVAPDHPDVKLKGWTFDRMLEDPRVSFLGGIELGRDVGIDELRSCYTACVIATGAGENRRLGIAGEDLRGSFAAADFVRWYNGHPDLQERDFSLGKRVAIIGHGNVALDAARMLLSPRGHLAMTDITPDALRLIETADVTEIQIIGRSGPSQAGFTPKELAELEEVAKAQILVDPRDLAADDGMPTSDPQRERRRLRNLELFARWAAHEADPARKTVHIRFFRSPAAILGAHKVTGLDLLAPSGKRERLHCDAVIRSIGFRSQPIPDLPFDMDRSILPTDTQGRVVDGLVPMQGVYATGWARRGATGVIGTNKSDAETVVRTILRDLPILLVRPAQGLAVRAPVDQQGWSRIQAEERRRGGILGKASIKFTQAKDAIDWAAQSQLRPPL
jgi:ferredoxin/flavodoxin---NADP+ reductase